MRRGRDLTVEERRAAGAPPALVVDGDGFTLAFSTREGGVSPAPWDTLNLGLKVGDDGHHVRRNREVFCAAVGVMAADLVVPGQVHGTTIAAVGAGDRGRAAAEGDRIVAATDGLVTAEAGVPLFISFADCVPVFVAGERDDGSAVIALVHAGWRGMLAGIAGLAARRVAAAGAALRAAVVGPSICRDCFTVGADVGEAFAAGFPGSWHEGRVDLWAVAALQLADADLDARDVVVTGLCTVCDRRFFSHRRDAGLTGRQAAIAWIPGTGR